MEVQTPSTQAAGCCFSFVGDIATESGKQSDATRIKDAMIKSHIDLQEIVINEFEKQLKASNLFSSVTVGGNAYPMFKLSITYYGFQPSAAFSDKLSPYFWSKGVLVNADNSILWEKTKNTNPSDYPAFPGYTLEEYVSDPELLRKAYVAVSVKAVSDLIDNMRGQ
jgi:hypothetical protein